MHTPVTRLGHAVRARLRPLPDILVTVIVCLAVGHAVASVVLWLVSLPLASTGLEMSAAAWALHQWGFGLVLTAGVLSRRMAG